MYWNIQTLVSQVCPKIWRSDPLACADGLGVQPLLRVNIFQNKIYVRTRETVRRSFYWDTVYNAGIVVITRTQSETAHLRQRYVVRQVASPYSVWQRFPLCPIESNVNENFKVIQNPGFFSVSPQNWITCSCCHSRPSLKISERSFLPHTHTHTHTDRQTNKLWQKHNFLGGGNYVKSPDAFCGC